MSGPRPTARTSCARGSSLLPWAIRRGLIEGRCCSFPLPGPAVESTRPVRRRNSPESTGTAWGGPIDATDFRRDPPCRLRTLGSPGPHPRRRLRRLACGREGAELPAQLPDDRRIRARRSRAPGAQGRPGSPLPILRADARRGGFRRAAAGRPGPRVPAVGRGLRRLSARLRESLEDEFRRFWADLQSDGTPGSDGADPHGRPLFSPAAFKSLVAGGS